jgi:hypothetical protein
MLGARKLEVREASGSWGALLNKRVQEQTKECSSIGFHPQFVSARALISLDDRPPIELHSFVSPLLVAERLLNQHLLCHRTKISAWPGMTQASIAGKKQTIQRQAKKRQRSDFEIFLMCALFLSGAPHQGTSGKA